MELGSCTSPLLSLPSTFAELRTYLGGCHSFLASLTETPHLLFRTSMLLDRSRPLNTAVLTDQARDLAGAVTFTINTWLWNFGRPQPRIGGLSVAKTEGVHSQSRTESARRAAETRKARKRAVDQIWQTYTWYLPVIYTNSVNRAFRGFMTCLPHWHFYLHAGAKLWW